MQSAPVTTGMPITAGSARRANRPPSPRSRSWRAASLSGWATPMPAASAVAHSAASQEIWIERKGP